MDNTRAYKYEFVWRFAFQSIVLSVLPETSNLISLCLSQHLHLKIKNYWEFRNYCKELFFYGFSLFSAFFFSQDHKPYGHIYIAGCKNIFADETNAEIWEG